MTVYIATYFSGINGVLPNFKILLINSGWFYTSAIKEITFF